MNIIDILRLLMTETPNSPTAPPPPSPRVNQAAAPQFEQWYAEMAKRHNLSPDPEGQFYDYRAAYRAGAAPDAKTNHWPSEFKQSGHPNEIVGGFNTRTGLRVPGTRRATVAELMALGWDEAFAKANGAQ